MLWQYLVGAPCVSTGKRALVACAQRGIGRTVVPALARKRADFAINRVEVKLAAEELAVEVRALQHRAANMQGDVSKSPDVALCVLCFYSSHS